MTTTMLDTAIQLANAAFQYYIKSDVCIKDLAYDDLYLNLKQLVQILGNMSHTP